jgi:hypothetical protein
MDALVVRQAGAGLHSSIFPLAHPRVRRVLTFHRGVGPIPSFCRPLRPDRAKSCRNCDQSSFRTPARAQNSGSPRYSTAAIPAPLCWNRIHSIVRACELPMAYGASHHLPLGRSASRSIRANVRRVSRQNLREFARFQRGRPLAPRHRRGRCYDGDLSSDGDEERIAKVEAVIAEFREQFAAIDSRFDAVDERSPVRESRFAVRSGRSAVRSRRSPIRCARTATEQQARSACRAAGAARHDDGRRLRWCSVEPRARNQGVRAEMREQSQTRLILANQEGRLAALEDRPRSS